MAEDDSSSVADKVRCRRTGRDRPVREHLICPYCFGEKEEVASADHDRFCDFEQGKDPMSFGFPEDAGRWKTG